MNKQELYDCLDHPEKIAQLTIPDLQETEEKYPFFQTVYMLHQRNMYMNALSGCNSQLDQTAIRAGSREMLHKIMTPLPEVLEQNVEELKEQEDPEELHENILPEVVVVAYPRELPAWFLSLEAEKKQAKTLPSWFTSLDKSKRTEEDDDLVVLSPSFVEDEIVAPSDDVKEKFKQFAYQELIDNFIQKEPRIPPVSNHSEKPVERTQKMKLEDEFVTETLAKIYIKQGKYDRAISIFEKLSLKYPEKSIYFATQKEYVKQLIANNKE